MGKRNKEKLAAGQNKEKFSAVLQSYFTMRSLFVIFIVPIICGLGIMAYRRNNLESERSRRVTLDHPLLEVVDMPAKFGVGLIAKQNISVSREIKHLNAQLI